MPYSGLASVIRAYWRRRRLRVNVEDGKPWEGAVLFASFLYPAAGSDCCLGCCGAALLVTVMKYVVDAGVGVMASARPTCSLY